MRPTPLALLLLACTTPPPPPAAPTAPTLDAAPAVAVVVPDAAPPPAPDAAPAAWDGERGDLCKVDGDCGFDDPCLPTRCVGTKAARAATACDESAPPPGSCGCASGWCQLHRDAHAPSPETGCKADDDCALDASRGVCHVAPGRGGRGPIWDEGGYCRCDASSGLCRAEYVAPIPCQSYRDCSYLTDPLRPVPSSQTPRLKKQPVKPCADGEKDAVCVPASDAPGAPKTCRVVAWSC
jgi:hypothetical protein